MNLHLVLILWNFFTLFIMWLDKRRSVNHQWRVSEKTLFLFAFLFGGIGILCGMYLFHHKTNHWNFKIFVPIGIALNIAILFYYFK